MDDHNDVSFLLESLNQLLEQDADMLNTVVESNIRSLQSHLQHVLSFLKQNETKENADMRKNLNQMIRDLEVTINKLAVETASYKMRSRLGHYLHFCNHKMMLCRTNPTLQRVLKHIQDLKTDKGLLLGEDAETREAAKGKDAETREAPFSYMEDFQEVLGFDDKVQSIVTQLKEGDQSRLEVVTLGGNSGTGKTILAKKAYNHDDVMHHFDFRAWVTASWNCRPRELLLKILEYSGQTTDKNWASIKDETLTEKISECLKRRKYLIVIDGIVIDGIMIDGLHGKELWEKVCEKVWKKVKKAFPPNEGSRVLLITRAGVFPTSEGKGGRVLLITGTGEGVAGDLQSQNDFGCVNGEECWELLSSIPQDDKVKLAELCKSLPLSTILLLRGMLARKVTTKDWQEVFTILEDPSIEGDHEAITKNLLNQVYRKLPPHLGFCLLYFGMFRKGVEIPARQLIQLWIAEGFIMKRGTKTLEDLGEEYLRDLVDWSLIQVVARRADGGVKECKIDDLFHKFCISEGGNSKFFQSDHCSTKECFQSTRRLRIHVDSAEKATISYFKDYSDIRSFQLSIQEHDTGLLGHEWHSLKAAFKLLRVLNLGYVYVHRIPGLIGELIHLRYVRINSPKSKHVPRSICSLLNLQTLDLRESSISSMPKGIWKMQQLRHLHLRHLHKLPEPQGAKNNALGCLQTLSSIRPTKVARNLMINAKFPNLRRLKLFSPSKQETLEFLTSLDHLFHLESLKIEFTTNVSHPQAAHGPGLPDPSAFPLTLTKITLSETCLNAECITKLERLPNLQILKLLRDSVTGGTIEWNAGGFPQLKSLQLVELQLKRVIVGDKAMRKLQSLGIKRCTGLTEIPLKAWPKLQELNVFWPSPALRNTIREFRERTGCKVQVHPQRD